MKIKDRSAKSETRTLTIKTAHGRFRTPIFMPVATQASVKAISQEDLREIQADCLLANTYHLYLRPGTDIIQEADGLHSFMNWDRSILTDSGGYQVFSLSHLRKIEDGGVTFKSHHDGSTHHLTPEKVIELQSHLGSDIWTCLDVCPPYPCEREQAAEARRLTKSWANRSIKAYNKTIFNSQLTTRNSQPLIFGILQGSVYPDLRREAAEHLLSLPFDGIAIGGLSVGEPKEKTWEVLDELMPLLPEDKPRYLMGVGTPEDLWEAVERGVDMTDCVWPTRNARNGQVMTSQGKLYIKNAPYRKDNSPLDPNCNCWVCRTYSRAYLSHLYRCRELLSYRLLSFHNLHFLIQLMKNIQMAIDTDTFHEKKSAFLNTYLKSETWTPA
ncbi:MAG: tRNA guanosine(34) transglycosylase Tgt [Elusimicrobia bacterium]|nr:tRNA guanosine(34) transglycosylase Tgt [Elusimicrobiota bacterium]